MADSPGTTDVLYRTLGSFLTHGDSYGVLLELIEQGAALLQCDACAILLQADGGLELAAATGAQAEMVEVWQLEHDQGPCLEAFRTGEVVTCDSVEEARARWPVWAVGAVRAGFAAVASVPLVVDEQHIGAMNFFSTATDRSIDPRAAAQLGQLAATLVVVESRRRSAAELAGQLQRALDSRVVIEQAKGVLAERLALTPDEAFVHLRRHARTSRARLGDVAGEVVAGTRMLDAD